MNPLVLGPNDTIWSDKGSVLVCKPVLNRVLAVVYHHVLAHGVRKAIAPKAGGRSGVSICTCVETLRNSLQTRDPIACDYVIV